MSKPQKYILRLCSDIAPYINPAKFADKPDNIYAYADTNDITKIKSVIFGPDDTPYEGGIFFFDLKFSEKYPFEPPVVKFETIDNNVRFNPNLYQEGKVCLSILGTWSGPPWRPSQTLTSIMLSIQSLLSENPLSNEPGRETLTKTDIKCVKYNLYLKYHTTRLAIMQVIDGRYPDFDCFRQHFEKYIYDKHEKLLNDLKKIADEHGVVFVDTTVDYFVKKDKLDFPELYTKFKIFCEKTIPEIKQKYNL
jgi:ubiquitin-protein ligase